MTSEKTPLQSSRADFFDAAIVRRGGAIDLEGLIQQTSRALGFARTGKQIRQRLELVLNDLLQIGHLRWVGDRIASGIDDCN